MTSARFNPRVPRSSQGHLHLPAHRHLGVLHPHGYEVALDRLELTHDRRPLPTVLFLPSLLLTFLGRRKMELRYDTAHELHSRALSVMES